MQTHEMFEHPPLFLRPETDTPTASTRREPAHQLLHDYTDGSHFFRLLKPAQAPQCPLHQAPHGDSAHDFLVL